MIFNYIMCSIVLKPYNMWLDLQLQEHLLQGVAVSRFWLDVSQLSDVWEMEMERRSNNWWFSVQGGTFRHSSASSCLVSFTYSQISMSFTSLLQLDFVHEGELEGKNKFTAVGLWTLYTWKAWVSLKELSKLAVLHSAVSTDIFSLWLSLIHQSVSRLSCDCCGQMSTQQLFLMPCDALRQVL